MASACTSWATSLAVHSHLMVTLNPPSLCRCLSFPTSLVKELRHILYVLEASPGVKGLWLPRHLYRGSVWELQSPKGVHV